MARKPATAKPAAPKADASPAVVLVKMKREKEPFTADVHPAEVENFAAGGWEKV